jgi:hypothetical protein
MDLFTRRRSAIVTAAGALRVFARRSRSRRERRRLCVAKIAAPRIETSQPRSVVHSECAATSFL